MKSRLDVVAVECVRTELAVRGVSRAALARAMGISPASMARRMNLEVPLNLAELEQIAEVLEVPPERLLTAS